MAGGIHPPLSVIESWPAPNYINPETRGAGLLIIIILLFAIAAITVCARLWARLVILKNAGIDDTLIVLTMIPTLGLAISICLASRKYGFDKHIWDLDLRTLISGRKITMAIESFYIASTSLTKISILLFYRRMSAGSISPWFYFAVRSAIAFVISYFIVFQVLVFAGCRPLNAFWNQVNYQWLKTHKEGVDFYCVNETAVLLAASAISIIQDFLTCGMPLLLFWKLRLPKRQKFALAAIFGVGFFLCVTGILRMIYTYILFFQTYDTSWNGTAAWLWTGIEAHLAIVVASAPALKVFFQGSLNNPTTSHWNTRRKLVGGSPLEHYPSTEKRSKTSIISYADTYSSNHTSGAYSGPYSHDIELGGISMTREVDVASSHHAGSSYGGGETPTRDFDSLKSPRDPNYPLVSHQEAPLIDREPDNDLSDYPKPLQPRR